MTKFILLGHHRTGSTLICLGLRQNRFVCAYGELLGGQEDMDGPEFLAEHNDGNVYLRDHIYARGYEDCIRAVGFKIFYDHARKRRCQLKAWTYLTTDSEIAVIHLRRENLLDSLVSRELANQTGHWHRAADDSDQEPLRLLHLDPDLCVRYFEEISERREWCGQTFGRSHRVLDISYERDICVNYTRTMHKVFSFLDVPACDSRPALKKLQTLPVPKLVANYDALRETFAGSPYEGFFTHSNC